MQKLFIHWIFHTSLGFKKVGKKEINKGIVSIPMKRNI